MKLKQTLIGKSGNVRKPADVFKKCPQCGHGDLVSCEGDVMCLSAHCDWTSIEIYADALMESRCETRKQQTDRSAENRKTRVPKSRPFIEVVV